MMLIHRIVLLVFLVKIARSTDYSWEISKKLTEWLHPFDLCLLQDSRNVSIDIITNDCQEKIGSSSKTLPPVRCRLGNTWPSRSAYCDPTDIPFSKRINLQSSISGYDDPQQTPLKDFFQALAKKKGLLLLIGDSVMQQFFGAMACELEREKVWEDPSLFTNTDELRHVTFQNTSHPNQPASAAIKFLPIYHLVNGRHDRVPNAAFTSMIAKITSFLQEYSTLIIVVNMGLHYIDNPVHGFSRKDYQDQMTRVLSYFHELVQQQQQQGSSHEVHVYWRETSAQHFDTPNGYWPGAKFIHQMKAHACKSIEGNDQLDWRNRDIEKIIQQEKLTNIHLLPFYNITHPLWSEHPNGQLRDCTHFCWSPMFYQPLFHQLRDIFPQ